MRLPLIFLVVLLIAQPGDVAAQQGGTEVEAKVVIGARADVPPFVWKDERSGQYLGFLWDVCTDAVTRAGYTFEVKEIDGVERAAFLRTGVGGFDLLCDPTTITLSRMSAFLKMPAKTRLRFSPIVFVANGSHVTAPADREGVVGRGVLAKGVSTCDGLFVAMANAAETKTVATADDLSLGQRIRKSIVRQFDIQMFPKPPPAVRPYGIWGYVDGTTAATVATRAANAASGRMLACPRPFKTHADAAEAFCSGRISRYYGDVEIVRAAIRRQGDDAICPADFTPKSDGSYEPYAFVVSGHRQAALPDRFEHAIYGMFSDKSVQRHFSGHFSEARKTRFLDNLFSINSLPPGAADP